MCGISYNFDVGRKALQINENVITKEAQQQGWADDLINGDKGNRLT